MDHYELVSEMCLIEKLAPLERIQLAKQRRAVQLMKWEERHDQDYESDDVIALRSFKLNFKPNIMLLEATSRDDIDEGRRLLERGIDPNVCNEDGLTALHQCAIDNNDELLLVLIEDGANVNARDSELWTPLHASACCGYLSIVRHLVENGAELLAVNSDGNMPYDICDEEDTLDYIESEMAKIGITQEDIDEERLIHERNMMKDMESLLKNGRNFEFKDEKGATPLHVASAKGYYTVLKYLLEVGASVHVRDNDGWQPVHAAACWAQPDSLELLVSYGADINARTPAGETPFDLCDDDSVRAVISTLQMEQRRKLLSFARDSRRMSKRRKPSSKFESPNQGNQECNRLSASRGAIKRHSLRDRAGVTLARLEARREAAILRRFSFEGPENFVLPLSTSTAEKLPEIGNNSTGQSTSNDSNVGDTSDTVWPTKPDDVTVQIDNVTQQPRPRLSWSHKARKLSRGRPSPGANGSVPKVTINDDETLADVDKSASSPSPGESPTTPIIALPLPPKPAMTLMELKRLRSGDRRAIDGHHNGKPTAVAGSFDAGDIVNAAASGNIKPRRLTRRGKINLRCCTIC